MQAQAETDDLRAKEDIRSRSELAAAQAEEFRAKANLLRKEADLHEESVKADAALKHAQAKKIESEAAVALLASQQQIQMQRFSWK
jgi:hypothetical protein